MIGILTFERGIPRVIYIKLLITFFKIGLVSFGGGYAMIPIIEEAIIGNGWLSPQDFYNIIAISETTPGPIAVNSATFVGYKVAGFLGGVTATIGIALPSLIIIILVSTYLFKYRDSKLVENIFGWLRPVITGLIIIAGFHVAKTSLIHEGATLNISTLKGSNILDILNVKGIIIFVLTAIMLKKTKIHPILAIVGSGILGIALFYFM